MVWTGRRHDAGRAGRGEVRGLQTFMPALCRGGLGDLKLNGSGCLNDAARPIWLAKGIGAHSLDDLERLRTVGGRCLVPELNGDVLDKVCRIIESGGYSSADLGRQGGEAG